MSEKTEQPTAKKLRDARNKGNVCKSQEVPSAASVTGVFLLLWFLSDTFFEQFSALFEIPIFYMNYPFEFAVKVVWQKCFYIVALITVIVISVAAFCGVIFQFIQVGVLFSMKAAMPSLDKLNPKQWFSKTFSIKNAVEFLKSLIKVFAIGGVIWVIVEKNLASLLLAVEVGPSAPIVLAGVLAKQFMQYLVPVFVVLAVGDYLFQRWQYIKGLMMTKDEVKQEYKESEGDPQIKGQRKQLHQEMVMSDSAAKVRKADVLVTNPTHYAVGIMYDEEETPLPLVLCKGEGGLALRMIDIAKQEDIPIMQNVSLARGLYADSTEGAYIPKEYIKPVAEVLRWVHSLR
ncbi:type III secretion system export apparatus subunit SctU [Halodesulfovibrio marinisediminis]|uniref:Type III secretion protein U n=1 Tax=Halodesulfovibrio marinisediminis DSM 17456 TaxID=1121457 RepID=A0A1N6I8G6_9BACT|nr:type III secretion system export apparatus subunit SctU [Halodesulfovibrio marinisediminis]SIO28312.1 type III secretion protein U [Halodesulfovibrio marinisediminis DSM 17456]